MHFYWHDPHFQHGMPAVTHLELQIWGGSVLILAIPEEQKVLFLRKTTAEESLPFGSLDNRLYHSINGDYHIFWDQHNFPLVILAITPLKIWGKPVADPINARVLPVLSCRTTERLPSKQQLLAEWQSVTYNKMHHWHCMTGIQVCKLACAYLALHASPRWERALITSALWKV